MKKHKILIIALLSYLILGIMSFDKVLLALSQSKYYFIEMLQILPAVFILTSLIQTWVPTKVIMKYFGDGSGLKGYGISFLIGSLSAGPIYAAFPVCQTLFKKGAGIKNIMIILSTWAVVKVPMLINEAKFMGVQYMAVRWLFTVIAIFIMAFVVDKLISKEDIAGEEVKSGIDTAACVLCGNCLKEYPDKIILIEGKFKLKEGASVTKELQDTCPVSAIN
jgi:uncharacterized membrane protein YraQ (UPF0718 family)